jgi:hypothetical protein
MDTLPAHMNRTEVPRLRKGREGQRLGQRGLLLRRRARGGWQRQDRRLPHTGVGRYPQLHRVPPGADFGFQV